MSHRDPHTGVMVSGIWEVFTPGELEKIHNDMEEDRKKTEDDMKNDKLGIYKLLREYGPDYYINVVKVIKIINVKHEQNFRHSSSRIIAEIIAWDEDRKRTIKGKVEIISWDYGGSWSEPPDSGVEISWLPKAGQVSVTVPRSILDMCYFTTCVDEKTTTCCKDGNFDFNGFPVNECPEFWNCEKIRRMNLNE